MDKADAVRPEQTFVLSRDLSAFQAEHLFACDRPVPGEDMVTLSGHFLTKVFEGPYSMAPEWIEEMEQSAMAGGHKSGPVWFFYTTCPKCQKVYGRNPVVGVVELTA